jgi:hypothetical protein
MPDRLSDIINVKDWGALGNQVANDTAAIQAAINYSLAMAVVKFSSLLVSTTLALAIG